ncbi:hypothetical protein SLEP1_g52719 [Rubroshorea leprosula]|uniref:Reverse transcriptase Ty1/copia-type domain-containing protein n=1 Tax=Rubroshorea leprosula TaxID=152421 RepID=A0AAV5M7Y4_9ROSI|nr:hypothetical protein SLEP1_g52719 [Rubroshorea leprosula]
MPISIEPRFPLGSSPLSTWQESYPHAATSSTHPLGLFPTTIPVPSKTTSLSSQSISPSRSPSLSQTPLDSPNSPITNSSSPSPTTLPTNSPIPSPTRTSNSPSESSSNDSPPSSLDTQISASTSSSPFHPIQPPAQTHPMVTCSRNQIFKPKQLYLAETPCSEVEPTCVSQALKDHRWRQAMFEEFNVWSDYSLFIHRQIIDWLYVLVHVDDILFIGSNPTTIDRLITTMSSKFSVKNLVELDFFLGVEAIETSAGLFLSERRYIQDILQQASMENAKPAVKRVLRYLNGTKFHGLVLRPQTSLSLHGFSDADWAGDKDTLIFTTSYVMYLGSNPVSWKATKQQAVARSSTEVEYRALIPFVQTLFPYVC